MTRTYEDLLDTVHIYGAPKWDRTGTGTYSHFGGRIEYDIRYEFPLITSKRVFFKGVVAELFWMLSGDTNVKALQGENVHIWDEWADEDGNLGPVYGEQWRRWPYPTDEARERGWYIDQIASVLDSLKNDPYSRRHIVSAWNVAELSEMALMPCHMLFQFNVEKGVGKEKFLDIQVYQRSADMFLGVPFNLAFYALLLELFAKHLGYTARKLLWVGGDCHLYKNHMHQAIAQLWRHRTEPIPLPELSIWGEEGAIFDEDANLRHGEFGIDLHNYFPHPAIKAPVAV